MEMRLPTGRLHVPRLHLIHDTVAERGPTRELKLLEGDVAHGLVTSRKLPNRANWPRFEFGQRWRGITTDDAIELFGLDRVEEIPYSYSPVSARADSRRRHIEWMRVSSPEGKLTEIDRLVGVNPNGYEKVDDEGASSLPKRVMAATFYPGGKPTEIDREAQIFSSLFYYLGRVDHVVLEQYRQIILAQWANPIVTEGRRRRDSQRVIYTTAKVTIYDSKRGGITYYCDVSSQGTTIQVGNPDVIKIAAMKTANFDPRGKLLSSS